MNASHDNPMTMMQTMYAGMKVMFRHVKSFKGADVAELEMTFNECYQQTLQEMIYAQKVSEAMQIDITPVHTALDNLFVIRDQITDIYDLIMCVKTGVRKVR